MPHTLVDLDANELLAPYDIVTQISFFYLAITLNTHDVFTLWQK